MWSGVKLSPTVTDSWVIYFEVVRLHLALLYGVLYGVVSVAQIFAFL